MNRDPVRTTPGESPHVVLDPTLGRLRRRWFCQPPDGVARRAFTAGRAARGRRVRRPLAQARQRWRIVREVETICRHGAVWF